MVGGNLLNKLMPMVAEGVLGFFLAVMEVLGDDDDSDPEDDEAGRLFQSRVEALGRQVARLRTERKAVLRQTFPFGAGSDEADSEQVFTRIKQVDLRTEMSSV